MDKRLQHTREEGEKMTESTSIGRIIGWKSLQETCAKTVNELVVMCEFAKGKVDQLKQDTILLVERRNAILMSNN